MRRRCKISVEITNGIKACCRYATYPVNTCMRRFVPADNVIKLREIISNNEFRISNAEVFFPSLFDIQDSMSDITLTTARQGF